jgi:DNA-binding transcriptional MocR family regulator
MNDRQFKGIWIPAHIWEQLDLTAAERCLWAEIDSFTNAKSGYYKTNQQASEELGISERSVSRAFAKLENLGAITIEKSGVRRVAKSTQWRDVLDSVASNPRHSGEVSSPEWRGIKNKEKNKIKNNENTVVMPFDEKEFVEIWRTWKRERQAYTRGRYTPYAQQRALNKLDRLSHGNLELARKIIDQSITNGWKDFYPYRDDKTRNRPSLDATEALNWSSQ